MKKTNFYVAEDIPESVQFTGESTFGSYATQWLSNNKNQLAIKTFQRYSSLLITIIEGIGHIRLNKLEPYHLNEYYKKLASDGANKKTGKGLSQKTILHHHRLISVIIRQATRDKIISCNIADRDYMKAPKVINKEARYLDEKEVRLVLSALKNEPIKWRTALLLLFYTGVRRGELCGLEWKDIDFTNKLIHIVRTSQYISKVGIITKETKNESSFRTLRLSDDCVTILSEYKNWLEGKKVLSNWQYNIPIMSSDGKVTYQYNDRLFVQRNGLPMNPDSVTDWTSKFCKKYKFNKFSPHSLRHTNVTLLIAAGVSLRQIAARVGHAQTSTTCNIYAHAIKSADEAASKALNIALKN